MTRIYRYIFNTNQDDPKSEIRNYLTCHKIKYSEELLLIFEIPESRADFIEVKEFLDTKAGKIIQVRLDYSKKELNAAAYLQLWLRKYSGYPQPETIDAKKSYINYTYDITNFCTNCGSGLIQNTSKSYNFNRGIFQCTRGSPGEGHIYNNYTIKLSEFKILDKKKALEIQENMAKFYGDNDYEELTNYLKNLSQEYINE